MPSNFGCLPSQIRYILTVLANHEILIYLRQSSVSFVHQFFQHYKVSAIARGGAQNPFYYFIQVSPPFFFLFPHLITYQPNFAVPKPRMDSVLPSLELCCLPSALKIGHCVLSKEVNWTHYCSIPGFNGDFAFATVLSG